MKKNKSNKNKGLSKRGPYKTDFKHIGEIIKNLPMLKTSKDFTEKLERRIKEHEHKVSKSKRKNVTKSSKR